MLERLRSATRADHAALEDELGLLRPPLSRTRFIHVLQGFRAFHAAWEPRVAGLIGEEALLGPRGRLGHLDGDLARLGAGPGGAAPFDLDVLQGPSRAWGSLYVMEGSTLGGQVISEALRREARWAPPEGLRYFDPYGRQTGAMWRTFRQALEAHAARLEPEEVVEGARATFQVLRRGLASRLERAA
jgi:heme oxygenase (biliverdin-IX-beta and delta-forming)